MIAALRDRLPRRSVTVGVAVERKGAGLVFVGPRGRTAWAHHGDDEFSAALGFVAKHRAAAHPWEPWPNPKRKETPS